MTDEEILHEWRSVPKNPHGNYGHGHVWHRPDGVRMRWGGPGMCKECAADLKRLESEKQTDLFDLIRRVREDEREECSKVADEHRSRIPDHNPDKDRPDRTAQGYGNAALNIAAALREPDLGPPSMTCTQPPDSQGESLP